MVWIQVKASRPGDVTCGGALALPSEAEERSDQSVERVWHAPGRFCGFPGSPKGSRRQVHARWPSFVSPDDCGWMFQGAWDNVWVPGRLALIRPEQKNPERGAESPRDKMCSLALKVRILKCKCARLKVWRGQAQSAQLSSAGLPTSLKWVRCPSPGLHPLGYRPCSRTEGTR